MKYNGSMFIFHIYFCFCFYVFMFVLLLATFLSFSTLLLNIYVHNFFFLISMERNLLSFDLSFKKEICMTSNMIARLQKNQSLSYNGITMTVEFIFSIVQSVIVWVTQIRHFTHVSRIGYVS
jgi:hypothetical protein